MDKKDFYNLMCFVPKTEIHVHEEAVLSRSTIEKVYAKNSGKTLSNEEYESLFSYNDFQGFLDSFIKIQSFFSKIEDLNYFFSDFADYLDKNNIIYCETFFSPTSHLKKGWDFHEMMSIISKNISTIKKERGKTVKILIDVSRSFGVDNAMNNLNLILKENNPDIIGIGLGGNEETGPARDFESVFKKAREKGLHIVVHAGEICGSSSIKDSLDFLKAERIGHGITSVFDEELIARLAKEKIPLEICPTSNIFTKKIVTDIKKHPVRKLYDKGVNVTLNTDDPTFFKVSLIDEYWNLYSQLDFTLDEIKQIIKNGFNSLFVSSSQKQEFCTLVDEKWNKWFASRS
ncbi:MAG: adenosine deaminase [Treponema sp.]|nr:adenosine deaminase [Spirochaetia bacterium]MDY4902904.1 adenosine deaminase [Treponema sp.]